MKRVNYMTKHPEHLSRMVAAYPIGFAVTKDYLERTGQALRHQRAGSRPPIRSRMLPPQRLWFLLQQPEAKHCRPHQGRV